MPNQAPICTQPTMLTDRLLMWLRATLRTRDHVAPLQAPESPGERAAPSPQRQAHAADGGIGWCPTLPPQRPAQ